MRSPSQGSRRRMVVEPADDTGRDKVFDRAAERSDFADATRRHEHVAARRREIDGLDIRSKVFVELLHLEFQSRPDRQMPERMLEYWIRLWRLHGKPIHQVVLYLKKTNSPLVQVDQLQVGDTRHRYGVVRLWEQDPQPLLQNPAPPSLPFASIE